MPVRALFLDAFATVLDWRGPFATVNEDALKRAHASVAAGARVPDYPAWRESYDAERALDRVPLDADDTEVDYVARFVKSFDRAGLGKRQGRVVGARAAERYFAELAASMRVAPDADDAFWRALPDDLPIVLVSNYGDGVSLRDGLDRLRLFYRFDAVVVSGDVGVRKPRAEIYAAALAHVDAAPSDVLMVGDDGRADGAGAVACGLQAAVLARRGRGLADERPDDAVPEGARAVASLHDVPALVNG